MTDTTLGALMKEIEKQQGKLNDLEETKKQLETELPTVKANLEALTRSLAILQGGDIKGEMRGKDKDSVLFPIEDDRRGLQKGSSTYIAYLILGSSNPLTPKELFEAVKAKKPESNKNSFLSGLYRLIRDKKYFKKDDLGKISILK